MTQISMSINGVKTFESKNWSRSINYVVILLVLGYHISLFYFEVNWIIYLWFISSMIHYYVHAYNARKTIVESGKFTFDELWHFINQLCCVYYMYEYDVNKYHVYLYLVFLTFYFVMLSASFFGIMLNGPLYYLGSFMAAFFIFSLRPSYILNNLLFFFTSYYLIVTIITFDNAVGRRLTLLNVAGTAFISEAIVLYLVYNGVY
jgi:hypothetical protein